MQGNVNEVVLQLKKLEGEDRRTKKNLAQLLETVEDQDDKGEEDGELFDDETTQPYVEIT